MGIDEIAMASVFEDAFVPFVIQHHGRKASSAVRSILSFIRSLYGHIAPEAQDEAIIVFQTLDDVASTIPHPGLECTSFQEIVNKVSGPCAIQIFPSGAFVLWSNLSADPQHLSQTAVVYHFYRGVERFYANRESKLLPK